MTKKTEKPAKRAHAAKRDVPTKRIKPAKPAGKTYVIFGTDEYAKPRGARFAAEFPELLAEAAEALRMRLVEVKAADEELAEVAAKLPAGRLNASGKGVVPYIKGELYTDLLPAVVGELWPQQNPDPAPQDLPRSWDEIAPGHVVIARETLEFGWWEAVVIERTGDLVSVRYRDYPDLPPRVRHRSFVALISPPAT